MRNSTSLGRHPGNTIAQSQLEGLQILTIEFPTVWQMHVSSDEKEIITAHNWGRMRV